jgi:hypothetical protein
MPQSTQTQTEKALRRSPQTFGGFERRARFSYDDLLELFRFMEFYENVPIAARSK